MIAKQAKVLALMKVCVLGVKRKHKKYASFHFNMDQAVAKYM